MMDCTLKRFSVLSIAFCFFETPLCVFPSGRKAVLGMVKKSKYSEVLQAELQERRTTSHVKFHMKYHIHDIVGAELVDR